MTEDLDFPLFTDSWTADLPVGTLTPEWAERLHLSCEVVIAGGDQPCPASAQHPPRTEVREEASAARARIIDPQSLPL